MDMIQDAALQTTPFVFSDTGGGLKTVLLAPAGEVRSKAGWFVMNAEAAASIIDKFNKHGVALPIDFEHESLSGRTRATGWIEKIFYENGRGLLALVRWTNEARKLIQEDHYRYLSPVFAVRLVDRIPIELHSAAITNKPAIPRMERIAASEKGQPSMDANVVLVGADGNEEAMGILSKIAGVLGMKDTSAPIEILGAALTKLEALLGEKDEQAEVAASVRRILQLAPDAAGSQVVLELTDRLQSKDGAELVKMREEFADLSKRLEQSEFQQFIAPYARDNKINPHDELVMNAVRAEFRRDRTALKANLDKRASFPEPGRTIPPDRKFVARHRLIANAEREWRGSEQLKKTCELRAFVSQSLSDASLARLADDEAKELTAAREAERF